jgi:predicted ATPase
MRIDSIHAENFKSLMGFHLKLADLTCLIGLNGSGKTTVLQFVDFLAQQARGDISGWLAERSWKGRDLSSRLSNRKNIIFEVSFDEGGVKWMGVFNTISLRCTTEVITTREAVLTVADGVFNVITDRSITAFGHFDRREDVAFNYQGSILSQLKKEILPPSLWEFRGYLQSITPLLLLSPHHLHQRARESGGNLGLGGEKLSAYIAEMPREERQRITQLLKKVYPQLHEVVSISLRSGWKQLEIEEQYFGRTLRTEARHVNDGLLRLLAILAELSSKRPMLLFDEIENGINPELVEFLIQAMLSAEQQILITTHSPMILNYLTDEQARAGVVYLYRRENGTTGAVHFFDIPSLAKKLSVMGPGEAFVDTDLTRLADEIRRMPPAQQDVLPAKR